VSIVIDGWSGKGNEKVHLRKNKPLLLNSLEISMIKSALEAWEEPEHCREEKAVLLNALTALEYIDFKDKAEEWRKINEQRANTHAD
jgi:hypothetical protein